MAAVVAVSLSPGLVEAPRVRSGARSGGCGLAFIVDSVRRALVPALRRAYEKSLCPLVPAAITDYGALVASSRKILTNLKQRAPSWTTALTLTLTTAHSHPHPGVVSR